MDTTKLLLTLLFAFNLSASTFYVAPTGSDSNPGTATAPLATIQRGVNLAKPGDTILVANGTYGPNGHFTCGTICSQNGYAAPVTFFNSGTASAPITIAAQNRWGTILDCGLPSGYSGDGTDGVKACDAYFDFQGSASYIVIRGFDVTRAYWVGAMVNGSKNQHIQFVANHFHHIGNRVYSVPAGTDSYGIAGVYAGTTTTSITFDGNEFDHIGRLPATIYISDDYTHDHGLYLNAGPHDVTNNLFHANTAGWGIQISPGTHDTNISNNTFQGANPQRDGLVMLWASSSAPNVNVTILNNIFSGARNYAIDSYQAYEAGTLIDHNIVYGSPGGVIDLSQVKGAITVTANRINTDPQFVGVTDFHLQASSPAIDTGVPSITTADFDGDPRPIGLAYDVGAYEFTGTPVIQPPVVIPPPVTKPPRKHGRSR